MELPNPPWYRRWSVILAVVIGLAAVAAIFGVRGLEQVASPNTTATTQPSPTVAASTTTVPPTSTQAERTTTTKPGVIWSERGHDVDKSPGIRVPGVWRIEWTVDCRSWKKYKGGNFKITGDGAFDGIQIQVVAIRDSGSHTFTGGGFGHLAIDSVCEHWTVTVVRG